MKMRTTTGGFDGFNSYQPGVCDVAIDHARRVFISGHGEPLDSDGQPLGFNAACEFFRLNEVERAKAADNHGIEEE